MLFLQINTKYIKRAKISQQWYLSQDYHRCNISVMPRTNTQSSASITLLYRWRPVEVLILPNIYIIYNRIHLNQLFCNYVFKNISHGNNCHPKKIEISKGSLIVYLIWNNFPTKSDQIWNLKFNMVQYFQKYLLIPEHFMVIFLDIS